MIAKKAKPFVNISTTTYSCASKFFSFSIQLLYEYNMYMCTKNVKAVVKFQLTGFKIMCIANYDWLNRDQVQQDWGYTGYMCRAPSNFARIFVAIYQGLIPSQKIRFICQLVEKILG